jgi:hypothetical protein|nr:MAG TPA: hypothetical protein [Caudoviricetes sp.]
MIEPKLTWHIKLDDEENFSPTSDRYMGTYSSRNIMSAKIRLWNNKSGVEDVDSLKNFTVKISFRDKEDSALLQYVRVENKDGNRIELNKIDDHLLLILPNDIELSGKANNGIESENRKNYLEFSVIFATPKNVILKEGDLKSLQIEIVTV